MDGPTELLVSFMCTPEDHAVVDKFTASCERRTGDGYLTLTGYQFPGETELHKAPAFR